MRMNWALLAALLCYAAAPAATCDPIDPLSPLNEPEWTLAEPATMSRALASTPMTQQTMQILTRLLRTTFRRHRRLSRSNLSRDYGDGLGRSRRTCSESFSA